MAPVVVITGASSGVGRATMRAFAAKGAQLGLIARGREGIEAARSEAESLGSAAVAVPADVADDEQVEAAAESIERELGALDIWVNNAMLSVFSPVKELAPEEVRRVTEVTYLGTVNGTLAALRRMLPRDRGTIVQVGSALAYRAIPLQAAYCGAKHAIQGFTQSLRTELLHDKSGVEVTMVHLPALNTPQFDVVRSKLPRRAKPVPPIFQPEVAAEAIVWAAEHPRREVIVAGSTLKALLADKLAPSFADRYLAKVGYDAQQTDEAEDADRADNLSAPLAGDRGAHGRFDQEARTDSVQFWLNRHRDVLTTLGAAALVVAARRARR